MPHDCDRMQVFECLKDYVIFLILFLHIYTVSKHFQISFLLIIKANLYF